MLDLQKDIATEAHADVEKLIYSITHRFADRFHIPYEEIIGQSYFGFMSAVTRFDPSRNTKLSTWVSFVLNHHLTRWCAKEYQKRNYLEINEEICAAEQPSSTSFTSDFKKSLSKDARFLVHLVLCPPRYYITLQDNTPSRYLRALTRYLINECKWDKVRVECAIDEVRVTLSFF